MDALAEELTDVDEVLLLQINISQKQEGDKSLEAIFAPQALPSNSSATNVLAVEQAALPKTDGQQLKSQGNKVLSLLLERLGHTQKINTDDVVVAIVVLVTIVMMIGFINLILKFLIGKIVETGIEKLAPKMLGVKVRFHSVSISPYFGIVRIINMNVSNPAKENAYTTPHLMFAGKFVLDINLKALFCSCFSTISIQKLVIENVHVYYEKPTMCSKSNVDQVLEFMEEKKAKKEALRKKRLEKKHGAKATSEPAKKEKKESKSSAATEQALVQNEKDDEKDEESSQEFILRDLDLQHNSAVAKISGVEAALTLPRITSTNFTKEYCENKKELDDVIHALVVLLLEGVLKQAVRGCGRPVRCARKAIGKVSGKVCGAGD